MSAAEAWVWMDGSFVRASQAGIAVGRWKPWASFCLAESLPVRQGRPVDLKAHLERLDEGCGVLLWPSPDGKVLAQAAKGLLSRNRVRDGGLRLRWWGGLLEPLLLLQSVGPSNLSGPVRLMTSAVRHFGPESLQARLKTGQMLSNLLARAEVDAFAEDGLRLTPDGLVAEGVFSNLALLRKRVLRTPPPFTGLLEGVTRRRFLESARKKGWAVREEPLTRFDLWTADRAWVFSSLRGVLPVKSVDGRVLG